MLPTDFSLYARAHAVVLQFAFSWTVYFSNRTESYLIFGRSRPWSVRIPIKEQCVFVCWFVGLLFIGHTTFVHFAALPPSGRESRSRRGRPRASGQAHAQREHARACRTISQRKYRCADAFQKQNRTRAHVDVYVTAEIFKKREKENQNTTSQVQFTVCLLLECLLFESY